MARTTRLSKGYSLERSGIGMKRIVGPDGQLVTDWWLHEDELIAMYVRLHNARTT